MKIFSIFHSVVIIFIFTFNVSQSDASQFKVDRFHSHVDFSIRHLMGRIRGHYLDLQGTFFFDEKGASDLKEIYFQILPQTISTGSEKRDVHLTSADFFDVDNFPYATFVSTKIAPAGKNKFAVEGNMSIHGITKSISCIVEFTGAVKNPDNIGITVGFSTAISLNRKDFGVLWNKSLDNGGLLLGDEVNISVGIEAQTI